MLRRRIREYASNIEVFISSNSEEPEARKRSQSNLRWLILWRGLDENIC